MTETRLGRQTPTSGMAGQGLPMAQGREYGRCGADSSETTGAESAVSCGESIDKQCGKWYNKDSRNK